MFARMRLLCLAALLPCFALAWGPTGHRVVGAIAEHHLSRKARKAVKRILGAESLAIASTWMDEVRSDSAYDHTHDWHWVTIPDGQTYALSEKNPKGDVVEAIDRMRTLLRSDTVPLERERVALRFLVHLVGDLHQPLHVGRGDDKGGNDFQVQWFKKGSNLHRVWDSEMIDDTKLSYTELAESLIRPDATVMKQWQSATVREWAMESMSYRPQVYSIGNGTLGFQYSYKYLSIVRLRILQSGIRLAAVLNQIYGK